MTARSCQGIAKGGPVLPPNIVCRRIVISIRTMVRVEDSDRFLTCLGLAVRSLRERQGVSQETFAAEVGVHRTYVGAIERGERNIGILTLRTLAVGLGTTLSGLIVEAERVEAHDARRPA